MIMMVIDVCRIQKYGILSSQIVSIIENMIPKYPILIPNKLMK